MAHQEIMLLLWLMSQDSRELLREENLFNFQNLPDCTHGDQLEFLRRVSNTTYDYAKVINDAFKSSTDYGGYETDEGLDRQLDSC